MALHSDDPQYPVSIDAEREARVLCEIEAKEAAYPVLTKAALEAAGEDLTLWRLSTVACSATVSGGYCRQMKTEAEASDLARKLNGPSLYATYLAPHSYRRGRIVWVRVP